MTDLAGQSIDALARQIASRQVSPVELTEAVLDNIGRYDHTLRAYIDVYGDDAIREARAAEAEIASGGYRGPLHGIPMGVKDNIYFAGRVTTMGSKIHSDFVPQANAAVVDRLADAGVVFLGKLNMHEYALGGTTDNPFYGTCRNPWDLDRTPGGSSGGAGAALASDLTIAALGTDTSGSIRIPAALCGIVGLKPTYGRVSRIGCFPEAWTLDHIGPMTRTVRDAALVLDEISGYDSRDPGSLHQPCLSTASALRDSLEGVTIGIVEDFFFSDLDAEVARCVWDGVEELRRRGAAVRSMRIPGLVDVEWALTMIDTSETSTVHHVNLRDRPQDYGDDVRLLLECGELPSAVDYLEAQQIRRNLRQEVERTLEVVDVLIGPTLPIRAPEIGAAECLVNGLPVGMQVIGPALGEQKVLDVGHALQLSEPLGSTRAMAYRH